MSRWREPQAPLDPLPLMPFQQALVLLPLIGSSAKKRLLSLTVAASPWLTGGRLSGSWFTVDHGCAQSGSWKYPALELSCISLPIPTLAWPHCFAFEESVMLPSVAAPARISAFEFRLMPSCDWTVYLEKIAWPEAEWAITWTRRVTPLMSPVETTSRHSVSAAWTQAAAVLSGFTW